MKTLSNAALALLALPAFVLAADGGALLPPAEGDLVPTRLLAAKSIAMPGSSEREPAAFAWRLEAGAALEASAAYVAESREFQAQVDAVALSRGYAFDASAPGAVIRISPLGGAAKSAVTVERLQVRHGGRSLDGEAAIERVATAAQLKAAGADFAEGTLAFRLRSELGDGRFELALEGSRGDYLVHVYEPASPVSAKMAAAHDTLLPGTASTVTLELADGDTRIIPSTLRGALVSPAGEVFDLDFALAADGRASAPVRVPEAAAEPGLWELHAFAAAGHDGMQVLRDVKTAVAVAAPTAHLAGRFSATHEAGGVLIVLPVTVAAPGRYELRGVLYGTAPNGSPQPIAIAHAARWLEPGEAPIALAFDRAVLAGSPAAPFELRELTLIDQSRIAVLEHRAHAARLSDPDPAPREDPERRQRR